MVLPLSLALISIHALREEGDPSAMAAPTLRTNFYPRPPRGGRLVTDICKRNEIKFLSTPSARRATDYYLDRGLAKIISIHALREEGDDRRQE